MNLLFTGPYMQNNAYNLDFLPMENYDASAKLHITS